MTFLKVKADTKTVIKTRTLFFGIIALIFVAAAAYFYVRSIGFDKDQKELQAVCTESVTGNVIDQEKQSHRHKSKRSRAYYTYTYRIKVRYTVDGNNFTVYSGWQSDPFNLEQAEVRYDPDSPETAYVAELPEARAESRNAKSNAVRMLIVAGVTTLVILITPKRLRQ